MTVGAPTETADVPPVADQWDDHWQEYQESARRNPAQDFRRRLVLFHLRRCARAAAPLRLLDVGAGTGDFAEALRRRFPAGEFLGLEKSATGVEIARRKVPDAAFLVADVLEPQSPNAPFRGWATVVVCTEVLEHVDEPPRLLENVKPYLAPGARLIVTVPGGPMSDYDRHLGHRRHFSRASLRAVLENAGFLVEDVWGAGTPFFNLYRLVIIARGPRLVREAAGAPGPVADLAMRLFGLLFRLNRYRSRHGWQIVGVARHRGATT